MSNVVQFVPRGQPPVAAASDAWSEARERMRFHVRAIAKLRHYERRPGPLPTTAEIEAEVRAEMDQDAAMSTRRQRRGAERFTAIRLWQRRVQQGGEL